jgi:queuine tRNA-ribosyltransferase
MTGSYPAYRDEFLARYTPASEKVREEQREKWKKAARLQQTSSGQHDQP